MYTKQKLAAAAPRNYRRSRAAALFLRLRGRAAQRGPSRATVHAPEHGHEPGPEAARLCDDRPGERPPHPADRGPGQRPLAELPPPRRMPSGSWPPLGIRHQLPRSLAQASTSRLCKQNYRGRACYVVHIAFRVQKKGNYSGCGAVIKEHEKGRALLHPVPHFPI